MLDKNIVKQSLTYAAGAFLYIVAVVTVMRNVGRIFGGGGPDGALAPIAFLLLFVVSAATMGMLIFGKPIMLYIDGKQREAVAMAFATIIFLGLFTTLVLVAAALLRA